MPRFYLRAEAVSGPRVTFDAQETRHLARVLRLRAGDVVHAVDGQGQELTVRLTQVSRRSAEGLILGREAGRSESPLLLTLVQGLPKGDKMEAIIRMATELGVTRVVPVITERTVVRADATRGAGRLLRWQRVAREAAKQCGRTVIPEVTPSRALAEWLGDGSPEGLLLCLWEDERACLADRLPPAPVAAATLVVGPEGGLAADEVE
ncbi:MAG: RsmE family RNA methyltransferase, partial [candidate division NC10 bacterium]